MYLLGIEKNWIGNTPKRMEIQKAHLSSEIVLLNELNYE